MAIVRMRWGQPSSLSFDRDLLHISPAPIGAGLAAAGFLCWLLGDSLAGSDRLINLALVLYLLAAIAWLFNAWRPRLARWFLVVAVVAVTILAGNWFELPGGPFLLLFSTALAATLISLSAATVTAVGESVLLVFLPRDVFPNADPATTVGALMGIWAMLGLMVATYDRIYWLGNWSWEQYQRARFSEEEAHRHQLELKQSLEDLAHANRQLTLLNDRLAAMRLIAEEAQRTKAAFVAKVSHEFRTPLNMIIGLTDLLVEKPKVYGERLPSALLDDLDIVRRNCEHLSEMINDVLDLSRAEVGHLALHRERANLADLVAESFAVVRPLLVKKGLEFWTHIPADLPEVYCDRTRIRQVILNLVSNAARFTEKGGITVSLCRQGDYVSVSVKDTGPGISPEDARKVFEPFYQGTRKTARDGGGSGFRCKRGLACLSYHDIVFWIIPLAVGQYSRI